MYLYFVTTVLTVPLSFEFFNVADLTIENDWMYRQKDFLNKIIMLFSHLFNSLKILSSHVYYFFISVIEQAWKKKGYLAR